MDKSTKKKSSGVNKKKRSSNTVRKKISVMNKSSDETESNSKTKGKQLRGNIRRSRESVLVPVVPPHLPSPQPQSQPSQPPQIPQQLQQQQQQQNEIHRAHKINQSTMTAPVPPTVPIVKPIPVVFKPPPTLNTPPKKVTQKPPPTVVLKDASEEREVDMPEFDPIQRTIDVAPENESGPSQSTGKSDSKKAKWIGDEVARQFVEQLPNEEKLRNEYNFLESFEIKKACTAFKNNMERNRSDKHIVLDENRVVLDRPGDENLNYINASRITVPDVINKFIVAQLPKLENESFVEDFWFMVHQEQINIIYLLCSEELTGPKTPTKLFQENAGEYQYVGKMFINTRKAEMVHDLKINTIEVLPEGMSDAVICQVHQLVSWKQGREPKKTRLVIKMIHEFLTEKEVQNSTVCVVSLFGSGRACCFLAALISIAQLNKGVFPNIGEIFKSIKLQRPGATENLSTYLTTYLVVLDYIKRKLGDKEFNPKILASLKAVRSFMHKVILEEQQAK